MELLNGQLLGGLDAPLESLLAQHDEFPPSSFGKGGSPHRQQHVVSGAQLLTCLDPFAGASQPLAVQEVTPCHLQAKARAVQVLDRFAEWRVCVIATQQGAEPGFDPQCPFGGRGTGTL